MNDSWSRWSEANQAYLVAQFARIKAWLRGDEDVPAAKPPDAEIAAPAIEVLSAAFALTDFERELLLLCAGVEMDSELASLCAEAGQGRPHATFGLAMAILPGSHWSALAPVRPLRRWRMLETVDESVLVSAKLRIDERILHYLAGINYLDTRLQSLLRWAPEAGTMATSQEVLARRIAGAVASQPLPIVQLAGNDGHGQRDVAARVAALSGLQLHVLSEEDLPTNPQELEMMTLLWGRETALLSSALLIECGGERSPGLRTFVERVDGLVLVATRDPLSLPRPDLLHRVDKPAREDQIVLWMSVLNGQSDQYDPGLDSIASEFSLSARDIQRIGIRLDVEAGTAEPRLNLWDACRSVERVNLDGLAQRIQPTASWDDLVLPQAQKATLRQIASHVRHRPTVYDRWGFQAKTSRGLGISALFAGASGTGKTMAAEVLAKELQLDLYRIDLSAVVSKYIGETEKNLSRVFDAAEVGGVILLFDEADALFGKRSEVKDSHDRYANIEVSYLLQRMEVYRGLAILTTNQKSALDTAFQRRLRFSVNFPFPDAAEREQIWRGVFPKNTPTAELVFPRLARLHMAGGHIRNIALHAAFDAAEHSEPVEMKHLLRAAHSEAGRTERGLTDAETRGWI